MGGKVVASLDTENMKVLTMMDYVDVLEEEIVEGMEDNEHSHDDHGHAHENEEEDHDHSEMDHSRPDDEIKLMRIYLKLLLTIMMVMKWTLNMTNTSGPHQPMP